MNLQDRQELTALLGDRAGYIHCVDETGSTMEDCRLLAAENAPSGSAVLARCQTAGRGRLGRDFHSPEGGVYLSVLLEIPPGGGKVITSLAGLAVCRAIEDTTGLSPEIKWPNDLILERRKVCGILTQGVTAAGKGWAVVGIGINLAEQSFGGELEDKAVSLAMLGQQPGRIPLVAAVVRRLDELPLSTAEALDEDLRLELVRRSCTVGREVTVGGDSDSWTGRAVDITQNATLVVARGDGSREVLSGEVGVRGLLGYV